MKKLREIAAEYGTPFLLYDEKGLGISAKSLFSWCAAAPDTSFYLPIRCCMPPMPFSVLSRCGVGVRCETPAELRDALSLGVPGDRIRYAARVLPCGVDTLLRELDATLQILLPTAVPKIVPRRVELACGADALRQTARKTDGDGLTLEELHIIAPELLRRGAQELGLLFPLDGNAPTTDFMPKALDAMLAAAETLREVCGDAITQLDLGFSLGRNYHRFAEPFDAGSPLRAVCEKLKAQPHRYTLSLCPDRQLPEPNGLYVTRVLACCDREHAIAVVTDADPAQLDAPRGDRHRHAVVVSQRRKDLRLCRLVGLSGEKNGRLLERCWMQNPVRGDLIVLRDMGCALRKGSGVHRLCLHEDGSVTAT